MYLLNVSYSQSPVKVEPHVSGHSAWVKQHLDEGTFLFAGPKKSGLGGVILVKSIPREELRTLLSEIPTYKRRLLNTKLWTSTASSPFRT